jgi:hypothetical protein
MKKNIILLFLVVILSLSCQYNVSVKAETESVKSYGYYHNILTKEIYPGIEKIASKIGKDSEQKIDHVKVLKEIYLFLEPYITSGKIVIDYEKPPLIAFSSDNVKLKDGSFITYIVMRLEVIDEAKSDKYIHFNLIFYNSFIIKRTHTKVKI